MPLVHEFADLIDMVLRPRDPADGMVVPQPPESLLQVRFEQVRRIAEQGMSFPAGRHQPLQQSTAAFPEHPVTHGVKPFEVNDEWYFHMRFRDQMQGVTPILSAHPPASTMKRGDGPHSGNPAVRKAVASGEPQHVAWVAERPGGGRGFGFTGGHYHWNWGDDNFRKLVLNAVLWVAGVEVPEWMDGKPLPMSQEQGDEQGREYTFTQYESHTPAASIIMNSMYANNIVCTLYERSKTYEGTEGELYNLAEDPGQLVNLWNDPAYAAVKAEMIETIRKDLLARPMFHNSPIPGALI